MKVIVVGAGIWGLACAKACAERGMQVSIYDKEQPGAGASGGVVGALAPYVPDEWSQKKRFQFEAMDSAEQYWRKTDETSGISSGYGRIGRWSPILSQRAYDLAQIRTKTSAVLWQGKYSWIVEDRPDFMSEIVAPFGVIKDSFSARILPSAAVSSLTGACKKLDVQFFNQHKVLGLAAKSISGDWGSVSADAIIVSAGHSGFELLSPFLPHAAGGGVKGQAALLQLDLTGTPQINGEGVYIIPHSNSTVAVGSTSETNWEVDETTDHLLDGVIAKASLVHPLLKNAPILKRWAGVRPKARRSDAMVGPLPNVEGVFIAAGGFKVGLSLAHKIAEMTARMVDGEDVDIPRNFTVQWHMA